MADLAIRPWCAEAVFAGKRPFIGGTIIMPADAASHEVTAALEAHFLTFLPSGFQLIRPICGAIFFRENADG